VAGPDPGWIPVNAPPLAQGRARPLVATFLERPHRFAAICRRRDGEVVAAHVPNPGRLTGVLAPRCTVLLDGPFPPPRSLLYTMLAARPADGWIGTNTLYANRVFPALVSHGLFPELGSRLGAVRAEVAHGRSRFDFQLGKTLVEVKSVTLAATRSAARAGRRSAAAGSDRGAATARVGAFPDAVSARAARHCDELAALARARRRAAIVFVAQRGDVASVAPADDIDPDFGAAIRAASAAGVLVLACALDMTPAGATRARRIPVHL